MKNKKNIFIVFFLIISFILGIVIYRNTFSKTEQYDILQEEDLKTKQYIEDNEKNKLEYKFDLDEAIDICKNKYGADEDTIYTGNDMIEEYDGKLGYIIQVKSKELMKIQGNGILFNVFVSEDGEIIEIN